MSIIDVLIIYFAIGAPFAAYRLARYRGQPLNMVLTFAVSWLFWPWKAAQAIWRNLNVDARNIAAAQRARDIASQIETVAFRSHAYTELTEFRDRFEAYSALAIAARQKVRRSPVANLFEIAGHPAPDIASDCLLRKQHRTMEHHLDRVRHEFVQTFAGPLNASTQTTRLTGLLLQLSAEIDPQLRTEVLDRLPARKPEILRPATPSIAGGKR